MKVSSSALEKRLETKHFQYYCQQSCKRYLKSYSSIQNVVKGFVYAKQRGETHLLISLELWALNSLEEIANIKS